MKYAIAAGIAGLALGGCHTVNGSLPPPPSLEAKIYMAPGNWVWTGRREAALYVCEAHGKVYPPICYGQSTFLLRCACPPQL